MTKFKKAYHPPKVFKDALRVSGVVVLGILSSAALTGCSHPTDKISNGMPLPTQTYEHIQALNVAVDAVEIIRSENVTLMRVPDNFFVSLPDQATAYLSRKFAIAPPDMSGYGAGYAAPTTLVIIIEDASVTHAQHDSQSRFMRFVNLDAIDVFDIDMTLHLQHRDAQGNVLYGNRIQASKRMSLSEHASLAERENKQFEAVEEIFNLLDPKINQITAQMGILKN